ncbi:hypothetical protein [Paraflavitalea speifideaquila]|uniref:hypothetical protein n=1 Tax=Paraflavitalea speifideaquila TaxID=3076558 RepID=UPI0028E54EA1|nr:hypothetical protein [Paraflavitalea speifideiaquila]
MAYSPTRYMLSMVLCYLLAGKLPAQVRVPAGQNNIVIRCGQQNYTLSPAFVVLYNAADPGMALKPAGIKKWNTMY